ncbi:hypothetical protein HPB50_015248 [Hyalomma asiaticum]|uniref:Uncharacterized protein n=1 Tax=Hyalomma asiaticum TaxID=266040 RepID=A0ACB7SA87_HYAAI|nr:hypothetical protein HPB50_015248 [Hyalomma asiaticum]
MGSSRLAGTSGTERGSSPVLCLSFVHFRRRRWSRLLFAAPRSNARAHRICGSSGLPAPCRVIPATLVLVDVDLKRSGRSRTQRIGRRHWPQNTDTARLFIFSLRAYMLFTIGAMRLGYPGIVHPPSSVVAIWMLLCIVVACKSCGYQCRRGSRTAPRTQCCWTANTRTRSATDSQLVVKWFLNDDPKPIYQWIPELDTRHVSQRLKGRLNTDFTVTANHFTKFRALNLLRPTTELSGRYSCHVTSHSSQDQKSQLMTVYARPKHFVFNYTRAAEESATTFVCEATGAFPLPTLSLYQLDEGSSASPPRRHALAPTQRVTPRQDGSYVTRVSSQVPDEQFSRSGRHLFVCLLSIPGTDFKKQRLIEFYPAAAASRKRNGTDRGTDSDYYVSSGESGDDTFELVRSRETKRRLPSTSSYSGRHFSLQPGPAEASFASRSQATLFWITVEETHRSYIVVPAAALQALLVLPSMRRLNRFTRARCCKRNGR